MVKQRGAIGLELFQALRPDHPIRRYESGITGGGVPNLERFIAGYLGANERPWTLEESNQLLDRAGLQFLFAATRWPWQADRVLVAAAATGAFPGRASSRHHPRRRQAELIGTLSTPVAPPRRGRAGFTPVSPNSSRASRPGSRTVETTPKQ